jgi:CheY-like chemotaxis protein
VSTSVRILVTSPVADQRETLLDWLALPTYSAVAVATFHDAKSRIDARCPDLLVTDLKLGEYNGLHLVVRGKARNPAMRAIILAEPDPVLEKDAEREGAVYMKPPFDRGQFQTAVADTLTPLRWARRSPHRRIAPLRAFIGRMHARVHDVSYEGLRLELPDTGTLPAEWFLVRIPQFNVALSVHRVWMTRSPSAGAAVIWCGATLATMDAGVAAIWRSLVDGAAGWTPSAPGPVQNPRS